MTELHRTDDEIGVALDDLRPEAAVATVGAEVPPARLPSRVNDGYPALALPDRDREAAVKELGIDTFDAALASQVRLDMRRPYVSGKGYVNLIRFSHMWSEVPRADWISWLDVAGYGGIVETWLKGLQPNKQYLIEITVSGWRRDNTSAFKVGSSAGFYANFPVSSTGQVQYLYGVLKPTSDLALVRLEPVNMEMLSFYEVELWPL